MNRQKTMIASLLSLIFLAIFTATIVSAATVTINYPYANSFNSAFIIPPGDGTNISINVTVLLAGGDGNVSNLSYSYRASPTDNWFIIGNNLTHNLTQNQGNHSYQFQWNISTLTAGTTYELNVTARNTTVIIGTAVITGITIDHTYPTVTLEVLDEQTNDPKSTFFFGDKVKIRCTRSDATAGYNNSNLSVQLPSTTSFELLSLKTTVGTASDLIEEIYTSTTTLGTYLAICSTQDRAGLMNQSVNTTFDVIIKPPQGSSRPQGFTNPVGKKIISGEADLGRLTAESPISVQLKRSTQVRIDVQGTTYTFVVSSFTENEVILTMGSTDTTIGKGESVELDLNDDGTNDVKVTYHKQFKKGASATADMTFETISTPVKVQPKPTAGEGSETTAESAPVKSSATGSLLVTLIVIVVIIVVGYFLIKGKKK